MIKLACSPRIMWIVRYNFLYRMIVMDNSPTHHFAIQRQ